MPRNGPRLICVLAICLAAGRTDPAGAWGAQPPRSPGGATLPLDDFETDPPGWRFVGGEEFPGAKGSLRRDTSRSHGGKASCRLVADFRGGGAYVGIWKDLRPLDLPDIERFRLRVRTE